MELRPTTNISKLDLSLDDNCSTGPWEACMYQTPDWNVNLAKGLLIKERRRLSLYKESGSSSPPLHDQKTILAEKVAFWKDDIYTKVVLEVRSKIKDEATKQKKQKKKHRHFLFELLRSFTPHTHTHTCYSNSELKCLATRFLCLDNLIYVFTEEHYIEACFAGNFWQ